MARDFFEDWYALFDESSNLLGKLHDDEDSDINDCHQMVLIQRDLLWLHDLVMYEMILASIEQAISGAISDNQKFEIAKLHYRVEEFGKYSIDTILDDCITTTIDTGYVGYFTEKLRPFVENVKDSFFSDSEESED